LRRVKGQVTAAEQGGRGARDEEERPTHTHTHTHTPSQMQESRRSVLRSEQFVVVRQKQGDVVREEMRYSVEEEGGGHALRGGLEVEEEEENRAGLDATGREDILSESAGDIEKTILDLLMPAAGHVSARPSSCWLLTRSVFLLSTDDMNRRNYVTPRT
jgi:hypothetical protein